MKITVANPVTKANSERRGGRQCFRPASWQQTFGKQSNVLLHVLGNWSKAGGGGGVHCKYCETDAMATKQHSLLIDHFGQNVYLR